MTDIRGALQHALRTLGAVTETTIKSHDEYVIWRHQLVGSPNPRAQNMMSEDPEGLYWDTHDSAILAKREGPDDMGRTVFYCRVEPVYGDLFITLVGRPQTEEAALQAPYSAVYRTVDFDVRREPNGRIISAKIFAMPDRTGQWSAHPRT